MLGLILFCMFIKVQLLTQLTMKEYKYDIIVALFGVGVTMLFFGFELDAIVKNYFVVFLLTFYYLGKVIACKYMKGKC